jgi:2-oxoglutarate dehydrogenase E2 component (dihydrolipoamide succinyltransferase)
MKGIVMALEIKVPPMGESISEATVASWHKKPGDPVKSGDILVELETDKVTMEVPSPVDGVLKEIRRQSGETVKLEDVLAIVEAGAVAQPAASAAPAPAAPAAVKNETLPPGARRLAEEAGVDTSQIQGSGKRGQVTKPDIVEHIEKSSSSKPAAAAITPSRERKGAREEVVPMSRLRQRIAERLVEAQHTAAILTTFNEVDMSAVMDIRNRYKDVFEKKHGAKLGFMSFFVKAVIEALKAYPAVNAEIRGTDIVYKNYYDIGVAVGGPRGLVVPIVRDADLLTMAEIELEIARLAARVKEGTITLDEMSGGTFTISNGGIYGSMMSTPILNPPQSGILGMHNITKRPVVVNDQIVIRPMMYLALSYDHRIIDGKEAVSFLVKVKECVENPERMLLEV